MKTAMKILPGLLRDHTISFKQPLQSVIHLTGYMIQPLMVISFILSCLATFLGVNPYPAIDGIPLAATTISFFTTGSVRGIFLQNLVWSILTPFIILCTFAPWVSLISTIRIQKLSLLRNLASLLMLVLLSFGISLSAFRGVNRALFSKQIWEWIRTPKYAAFEDKKKWRQSRYQMPFDPLWIWELIFFSAGLLAIGMAIQHSYFARLLILVPCTLSYGFVLLLSFL